MTRKRCRRCGRLCDEAQTGGLVFRSAVNNSTICLNCRVEEIVEKSLINIGADHRMSQRGRDWWATAPSSQAPS